MRMDDKNEIIDEFYKKMTVNTQKYNEDVTFGKKVLYIFGGVAGIIVTVFLCMMIYKNDFTIESILSLLLAFFSIFISIVFYFKASDTSNKFYDTSYSFMKDVSVTLGKIEERFGEKLNNLGEKLSHISYERDEKSEELRSVEDEKEALINKLIEKAKLGEEEKIQFRKELQEKEKETEILRYKLANLDKQYQRMMNLERRNSYEKTLERLISDLSVDELNALMSGDISKINDRTRIWMQSMGITPEQLQNNVELNYLLKKIYNNFIG